MGLPRTTRTAILREHGNGLDHCDIELPQQLEPGAALVRITRSTLCGTDVEIYNGQMGFPGMLPMILGHEMVGEVVATGAAPNDILGRPVTEGARIGWSESTCGHCYGCAVLRQPVACSNRGYGFMQRADVFPYVTAGLSEYCYVTAGAAKYLLPEQVPDNHAAMAGCAGKTVLRAVARCGGITPGSTVVIQGSGALGIFASAVARLSGAASVIVIGAPRPRLDTAERFGATATVDIDDEDGATKENRVERVRALTGERGADHVFDFAGAGTIGEEAVSMAAQRGTVTIVGSTGPGSQPVPLGSVMGKELTVTGSLNGDISDYYQAVEFLRKFATEMPWDELFSEPVGLDGAVDSIHAMSRLDEIKAVIDPRMN